MANKVIKYITYTSMTEYDGIFPDTYEEQVKEAKRYFKLEIVKLVQNLIKKNTGQIKNEYRGIYFNATIKLIALIKLPSSGATINKAEEYASIFILNSPSNTEIVKKISEVINQAISDKIPSDITTIPDSFVKSILLLVEKYLENKLSEYSPGSSGSTSGETISKNTIKEYIKELSRDTDSLLITKENLEASVTAELDNFKQTITGELDDKLGKTDTAVNSEKFANKTVSEFVLAADLDTRIDTDGVAKDSLKLGGKNANTYATKKEISNLHTSIQSALDNKLSVNATAHDTELFDGLDSSAFAKVETTYTKEQIEAMISLKIHSRNSKFIQVRKLLNTSSMMNPKKYNLVYTEDEDLLLCGVQDSEIPFLVSMGITTAPLSWVGLPHPLKNVSKIKDMWASAKNTVYILYENGDLYGRGKGNSRELGQGNSANQFNWVKILSNVKNFRVFCYHDEGVEHSCLATKNDGSFWFFGAVRGGAPSLLSSLKDSDSYDVSPKQITFPSPVSSEGVKNIWLYGSEFSLAMFVLTNKDNLYAAGYTYYSLGTGNKRGERQPSLEKVKMPENKKVVQIVSRQGIHLESNRDNNGFLALCSDGTLYTWGYIGNGSENSELPMQLSPELFSYAKAYDFASDPFVKIIGDAYNYSVLTRSGRLFEIDVNIIWYLVRHTSEKHKIVKEITIPNKPNAVFKKVYILTPSQSYKYIAYAIVDEDNNNELSLYSWGINTSGALGVMDVTDKETPTKVSFLHTKNIVDIVCIGNKKDNNVTIFYLLDNGQLWGCGSNKYGQLTGLGSTSSLITIPTLIL